MKVAKTGTVLERIMNAREITPGPLPTPCWVSTRGVEGNGYTQIQIRGRTWMTHRLAYELLKAPIPEGLDLDHLCRVRKCFNPDHLEPVTRLENILRGDASLALAIRTNCCQRGHSLDDAIRTTRGRTCRTCAYERNRTDAYKAVRNRTRRAKRATT